MSARVLRCGRFELPLGRPLVMGILNITPDSFSDGGRFAQAGEAIAHAERMVRDGAAIIDVGAESTRPGAQAVGADEEWARLAPVLREMVRLNVPISVDTYRPQTMRLALDAGADMINDINALREPGAAEAVRGSKAALCLMHMRGQPATMQQAPAYVDVVQEALSMLLESAKHAGELALTTGSICIDPGFGFGKTAAHNLQLAQHLRRFAGRGYPLLVGLSRKNTLGLITGRPVHERTAASVAAALWAAHCGADIVRVHDVAETVDALKVWQACEAGTMAADPHRQPAY